MGMEAFLVGVLYCVVGGLLADGVFNTETAQRTIAEQSTISPPGVIKAGIFLTQGLVLFFWPLLLVGELVIWVISVIRSKRKD